MEGVHSDGFGFGLYRAYSVAVTNGLISLRISAIDNLVAAIPLAESGFPWLVPAIVGGIAGGILWKALGKESIVDEMDRMLAEDEQKCRSINKTPTCYWRRESVKNRFPSASC